MKKIVILVVLVALLVPVTGQVAFAAKPAPFTVPMNQAQFQWRAWDPMPSGTWAPLYLVSATSSDFIPTGNVLHTSWSYSPVVTDLTGQSTVYTYDKKSDIWIEKEGRVSYCTAPLEIKLLLRE